jgi:hypothetical protein
LSFRAVNKVLEPAFQVGCPCLIFCFFYLLFFFLVQGWYCCSQA